jgi:phosphate transport system substrate-binding protein
MLVVCAASSWATDLNGAGATFPNPIYSKWFIEYQRAHPDVKINYQSIGSGGGIRQLQSGTVDFGASDGPMSDEQLSQTPFKLFHLPTVIGAVVPAYNIPGVTAEIKFSPDVLADIYLGKITNWSDPRIAKENPNIKFPSKDIVVIHRAEASGTSYIFTDYLEKVSPEWKEKVGHSTAVKWPVGLAGKGNEGVAGLITQQEGSIGYVELIYALQNKITYGTVRNAAGKYVKASLQTATAAAASAAKNMPADYRVSITNAPAADAWPISSFTWLLVPVEWKDGAKREAMVGFLSWMLDQGQGMVQALDYAPLPKNVVQMEQATIKQIK